MAIAASLVYRPIGHGDYCNSALTVTLSLLNVY
jgi:hypothetical protein